MSLLLEQELLEQDTDDQNQFAHYAEKDLITEAYVMGNPIVALCGKIFIPSRDPERLPICVDCKNILESMSSD
jgi:hypothetical protein